MGLVRAEDRADTQTAAAQKDFIEAICGNKVKKDTGWWCYNYSERGIADYKREIEFDSSIDEKSLLELCTFLHKNNCPGWTGVSARNYGGKSSYFVFSTCWDSSD